MNEDEDLVIQDWLWNFIGNRSIVMSSLTFGGSMLSDDLGCGLLHRLHQSHVRAPISLNDLCLIIRK